MFERDALMSGRYLAGIWEGSIHAHLLWYARKSSHKRAFDLSPSWSWASVDTPVGWFPKTMPDFEGIVEDSCTIHLERTSVRELEKGGLQGKLVLSGDVAAVTSCGGLQRALSADVRFPWWSLHHPRFLNTRTGGDSDEDDEVKKPGDDHCNQCIVFDGKKLKKFHIIRLCSLKFRSGENWNVNNGKLIFPSADEIIPHLASKDKEEDSAGGMAEENGIERKCIKKFSKPPRFLVDHTIARQLIH
jgi:hypothetical protein